MFTHPLILTAATTSRQHGASHPTDAAEVLRRLLSRFDLARQIPEVTDLGRLMDLTQATLRGKDALVVLDNVEPALPITQVMAPLQAAGLTVLVTARHRLPTAAVPAEASRQLDLLHVEGALELFTLVLGGEHTRATTAAGVGPKDSHRQSAAPPVLTPKELTAARIIVETLGRHTLAVKLVGAYAGSELGLRFRELDAIHQALPASTHRRLPN